MTRRCDRYGFTLIELLVVIAIIGVLIGLLLPSVQVVREKDNQVLAVEGLRAIAAAQATFRGQDVDGDGLDDYATLAELGTAALIDPTLATGTSRGFGYDLSLKPPPEPGFELRAIPVANAAAHLRFFTNEAGLETFVDSGIPDPNSPPLGPEDECIVPPDPDRDELLAGIVRGALLSMDDLAGEPLLSQAIDLIESEPLLSAIVQVLDEDDDGSIGFDEAFAADLLETARVVIGLAGLPSGAPIGSDADLQVVLGDLQSSLAEVYELQVDPPQPEVLVSDLGVDQMPVIEFLQALLAGTAVPIGSGAGLVALLLGGTALGWRHSRR